MVVTHPAKKSKTGNVMAKKMRGHYVPNVRMERSQERRLVMKEVLSMDVSLIV